MFMALGEFKMFSWKSKDAQDKEMEVYGEWAFPFGNKQRENLEVLLKDVFPRDPLTTVLVQFLTCKELYEGLLDKTGSDNLAIDDLINSQKKYKQLIKKKDMAVYVTLVLADSSIDELCEYPSGDEIREGAQLIEEQYTNKT